MKKLFIQKIISIAILLIIIYNLQSCSSSKFVPKTAENKAKLTAYINHLKEEGYSQDWAVHKAKVELGFRKCDKKYLSIQED